MTIPAALFGFAGLAVVLTLIPGLDTTLVLRSAVTRTKAYAFATAFGIQCGLVIWGAVTALGATVLLAASQTAFRLLAIGGALYLVFMGVMMVRAGFRSTGSAGETAVPDSAGGRLRGFGVGLVTNLLNPKIGVFYLATIPQFVPADVSPLLMGVLLALVHAGLGAVWLSIIITGGRVIARAVRSPVVGTWVDRIAGVVIIAFGLQLVMGAMQG